ncbi:hypothetical protein [Paenibacillus sp. P3E]|nr:hypothetical protein [Paenibacillus sp. P3E]
MKHQFTFQDVSESLLRDKGPGETVTDMYIEDNLIVIITEERKERE